MSTREANLALLSRIPEEKQQQIFVYLMNNFCQDNPFTPKSAKDILSELEESRACYERGECEDFDKALEEISAKYDL